MRNKPEVLAPANSLEVLKTAVEYGADAVYIGGEMYGLRAKAKNFSAEDMKKGIFTDEDIENAKKSIISGIRSIDDEQDTEITYFFGQEITNEKISTEEYIKNINQVSKEDIIKIANSLQINTIYFLKNKEED